MRRHDFTPLFLFLALILGLALFAMCGLFNWGVGFAHVTKGECDTLYAACMSRVVPGEEPSPTPPAPVPPGPPSDTKPDWQCYLDRYEHVRVHKATGRVMPYTEAWAKRHWEGDPGRWGGKHEGLTFECEDAPSASVPILWKPVSETRGGTLVVLLPANWPKSGSVMVNSEFCRYTDVAGANGGRHHYWCSQPGASYPPNTILTANGERYLVPDPGQRYESLREAQEVSAKLPWHHSNQSGSFGTSVNLCEQYDAKAVNLNGTEWRYHRRDKGREVWHDPQMRDGMSGTITVELESGQVITAELTPGTGIRYSGDC